MARYVCSVCGYVHDDAGGELFADLPESWTCPVCGAAKYLFEREGLEGEGASRSGPAEAAEGAGSGTASGSASSGAGRGKRGVGRSTRELRLQVLRGHRWLGYVFVACYVMLIVQMVPRLWTYQIEFPARTVVHMSLGMAVGVLLLVKIGIVRYFRRLEKDLVPLLGTALLVCSAVLIGISVPWSFREAWAMARLLRPENRQRVELLLTQAGLDEAASAHYATADSLRVGQRVLRQACVDCHDLRTVLARPRTPSLWRQTVRRMAERTELFQPVDEEQQWQVTAYLTALSPQLQRSTQQLTDEQQSRQTALETVRDLAQGPAGELEYDAARAEALVAAKCAQCHDAALVADSPPGSAEAARELVARMVEEGMEATAEELALMVQYLQTTYIK